MASDAAELTAGRGKQHLELLGVGHIVCGSVHLGNDHAVVVLERLAQLVPDGRQRLAVPAPASCQYPPRHRGDAHDSRP